MSRPRSGQRVEREIIAWFWVALAFMLINGDDRAGACDSVGVDGKHAADRRSPDHEPHRLRRGRAVHELACAAVAESRIASR